MSISDTIIYGSLADVQDSLQQDPHINYQDEYGFTPLIQTTIMNNLKMGDLLLEHGADVNLRDLTGGSALHWTAENNNIPFCRLLLEYGADPNAYTLSSEPVLVKPLLRGHKALQNTLVRAGVNVDFAQDFINTKLLGHRYELLGYADIVDHQQKFTEVDFEGFILEFTIASILQSLQEYQNNFSARHLRHYFDIINRLIAIFSNTAQLIKYQQYLTDHEKHRETINHLLDQPMLLIPVAYEGHATSYVKYGDLLAKCDRSQNDLFVDNVVIYQITRPQVFTKDFIKQIMYKKQSKNFVDIEMPHLLGLKQKYKITIGSQISGNCSWANTEASIPVMLFLLSLRSSNSSAELVAYQKEALSFYYQWLEWDRERALHFCVNSFASANPARRASKAAILAAILFQRCNASITTDVDRARKIVPILNTPGYEYILKSYIEIYCHRNPSPAGENLKKLLYLCEGY